MPTDLNAVLATQGMALLPVGKNCVTIIDVEDLSLLSIYKWSLTGRKYAGTSMSGNLVYLHRMLMGDADGVEYDHRNGFTLDNRKCNLRIATHHQNMQNRRKQEFFGKPDRLTSSKYKGVYFRKDRQRWSAYIGGPDTREWLGCFSTQEEAALAYNTAAVVRFGEFARLNEVEP